MKIFGSVVAIVVLLASMQAAPQTLGYSDADNPSEAVGMMKVNSFSNAVLLRECSGRLPAQASEMAAQLKQWQITEAHDIELADYYWAQMIEKQPDLQQKLSQAEAYLTGNIALLEKTNPTAVLTFCQQHFADLASGVWRQRTPRLYAFLDHAQIQNDLSGTSKDASIERASPQIKSQPKPVYPKQAFENKISGTVTIESTVGEDGAVIKVVVKKSSGNFYLDNAAVVMARQTTYYPAFKNGHAIEAEVIRDYPFKMDN